MAGPQVSASAGRPDSAESLRRGRGRVPAVLLARADRRVRPPMRDRLVWRVRHKVCCRPLRSRTTKQGPRAAAMATPVMLPWKGCACSCLFAGWPRRALCVRSAAAPAVPAAEGRWALLPEEEAGLLPAERGPRLHPGPCPSSSARSCGSPRPPPDEGLPALARPPQSLLSAPPEPND
ncbi:hypothetical protein NDU88_005190 [Pleurodeles waltl]|uniref:Uncharacterized protein n=1 Tax=Pleurodeles waltl TaxID=8319 RepID=A0AAV7PIW2_PLEWA|nr:hypothetical protein NDU88_005190 [Pleurodeles waltl]